MKQFYEHYFGATAGEKYPNPKTTFQSYFLRFSDGARLEIGTREDLTILSKNSPALFGYDHLAISLGSAEKVDELATQFRKGKFTIKSGPRTTGDGYYEAVIIDPEDNKIELTI